MLLITFMIIWYLFPIEKTKISHFMPDNAISFVSFNINKKEPFIKNAIQNVKTKIINEKTGFLKTQVINLGINMAMPKQVLLITSYDEKIKNTDSVIIINFGRLTKLLKIFSQSLDSQLFNSGFAVKKIKNHKIKYALKPLKLDVKSINLIEMKHSYTIVNNNLLIGSSFKILQNTLWNYLNNQANKQELDNITSMIMPGASEKSGMVFLDNTKNHLSVLYKNIEEYVAFAAFPSIVSTNIILGKIWFEEQDIQLNFEFIARDSDKMSDIRSDVKFFYGAMKRVLKPRNIDLEYDIKIQENSLFFNCRIINLLTGILEN